MFYFTCNHGLRLFMLDNKCLTMFSGCCVWIPHYNGAWLTVCDTVTVLLGDTVLLAFEKILVLFSGHRKTAFYNCTNLCSQLHKIFYNCTICAQLHTKKTLLHGLRHVQLFLVVSCFVLFSEFVLILLHFMINFCDAECCLWSKSRHTMYWADISRRSEGFWTLCLWPDRDDISPLAELGRTTRVDDKEEIKVG